MASKDKSSGMGLLGVALGAISVIFGKAVWDVAKFSAITREANRVDELVLERASIDKELQDRAR
ncbi:MAG: hypothetical protein P8P30_10420 [Rickettsiales bacterium]|nr:hypothetical protein [Rickettsiales bacterium]